MAVDYSTPVMVTTDAYTYWQYFFLLIENKPQRRTIQIEGQEPNVSDRLSSLMRETFSGSLNKLKAKLLTNLKGNNICMYVCVCILS